MYLKVKKTKIPIDIKTSLKDKIVSFRFKLSKIDRGICFIKKRRINTYFYCQNVDIIMTDRENKIIKMFINQLSERKFRGNRKVFYTYVLPANSCCGLAILDEFPIILTSEEEKLFQENKVKKKSIRS